MNDVLSFLCGIRPSEQPSLPAPPVDASALPLRIMEHLKDLPPTYQADKIQRAIAAVVVVAVLIFVIIAVQGKLLSFPQEVSRFFQANWIYVALGVVGFSVWVLGAVICIQRATTAADRLSEGRIGKFSGESHWVPGFMRIERGIVRDNPGPGSMDTSTPNMTGSVTVSALYFSGYIDTSTLDSTGSGTALMYQEKTESDHYSVCGSVICYTSLFTIGTIIYNTIRLITASLFVLGCNAYEKMTGEKVFEDSKRFFSGWDVIDQGRLSWERIVAALFFGLALLFAAFYALVDPLNGRKLGAAVEREWNDQLTRAEGRGLGACLIPGKLHKFEGGGRPGRLGRNGIFLAGCWQPIGLVFYNNGKVIGGATTTMAINSQIGKRGVVLIEGITIEEVKAQLSLLSYKEGVLC